MIDIDKLRRLAQAVISKMNALDPEFVSSVTPLAVLELLDRLEAAEEERDTYKAVCNEWIAKTEWVQDELHRRKLYGKYLGMHRADIIKVEIDALRAAVRHEADCVDAAKAEIDALRAKIEEMEKRLRLILEEPENTMSNSKALREMVRQARLALEESK